MRNEIKLGNVMVDCYDELKLQRFYGQFKDFYIIHLLRFIFIEI